MRIRPSAAILWVPAALIATAWLAYAPGLTGGFLFDDYANLPAIGATGPIDHWTTFWRYITSGTADPTGRPLALLSFLIDARNWPADPRPFLRTNIFLHLVNGILLAWLLRALGMLLFADDRQGSYLQDESNAEAGHGQNSLGDDAVQRPVTSPHSPARRGSFGAADPWFRINLAAALGAGFWLLHPLFVSTTLYIVQREAMLPATFVLLGLLAWLHGRERILVGQRLAGFAWLVLGLGGCTVLAVLSKANGILLPALALVLEYTVARAGKRGNVGNRQQSALMQGVERSGAPVNSGSSLRFVRNDVQEQIGIRDDLQMSGGDRSAESTDHDLRALYQRAMLVLAWLPAMLVALYLLHAGWRGMVHGVNAIRPWTLGQRLLTEPRILMDYLALLWLPRPFTPGLFNDFIHVSTSLLHPATTLPALAAALGLIIGAVVLRRRWPALAAAVLFYFVGQSIESSTLALELYFEHRNYLPAMLMFWPLALWLAGLPGGTRKSSGKTRPGKNPFARGTPLSAQAVTRLKFLFALIALTGLAAMTHARASLWGNQHDQALLWAQLNPDSPRAQAHAAQAQMTAGHPDLAAMRLDPLLRTQPDQVQIALNLFGAQCMSGNVDSDAIKASMRALRSTRNPGSLLQHWFERMIQVSRDPPCPQANLDTIESLVDAALTNPHLQKVSGRMQDLLHLKGLIALQRNNPQGALEEFNRALHTEPRVAAALQQAALLGSRGYPKLGLQHLDRFESLKSQAPTPTRGMPQLHAWVLHHQGYWRHEIEHLRTTLQSDLHP